MIRRHPRSKRTTHSYPTRRTPDLADQPELFRRRRRAPLRACGRCVRDHPARRPPPGHAVGRLLESAVMTAPLLSVEGLHVRFQIGAGMFAKGRTLRAVSDVSLPMAGGAYIGRASCRESVCQYV